MSQPFFNHIVNEDWIARDLKHVWHPCSQMKDYEKFRPIEIARARGCYLYTPDQRKILDAISSWWCKSLGHAHPKILEAVQQQLSNYEHVIGSNTCQKPLVELRTCLQKLIEKVYL